MERTLITRSLMVEEVQASSTRVLLSATATTPDRAEVVLDRDEARDLINQLGRWLLEWDEHDPTHLLVVHPEAELVSTRQRKGQTIITLQWTPAEDDQ